MTEKLKLAFIDLETTGLDETLNGITQIAFILDIDGEIVEKKKYSVKPFPEDNITSEALKVQKTTFDNLFSEERMEPNKALEDLVSTMGKYVNQYDKTDKFYFMAYNGESFDRPFLSAWSQKQNFKYLFSYLHFHVIDIFSMFRFYNLGKYNALPNQKLETAIKTLGLAEKYPVRIITRCIGGYYSDKRRFLYSLERFTFQDKRNKETITEKIKIIVSCSRKKGKWNEKNKE